jgi:hypothetical protein
MTSPQTNIYHTILVMGYGVICSPWVSEEILRAEMLVWRYTETESTCQLVCARDYSNNNRYGSLGIK